MKKQKTTNDCEENNSIWGKQAMGGCLSDYTSPPGSTWQYKNLQWVPVSESFKKSK